jgi:hypothetical protein
MKFRPAHETASATALRMLRAYESGGDVWDILDAAEARHGHAIAMEAVDEFEFRRRVADEDSFRAQGQPA